MIILYKVCHTARHPKQCHQPITHPQKLVVHRADRSACGLESVLGPSVVPTSRFSKTYPLAAHTSTKHRTTPQRRQQLPLYTSGRAIESVWAPSAAAAGSYYCRRGQSSLDTIPMCTSATCNTFTTINHVCCMNAAESNIAQLENTPLTNKTQALALSVHGTPDQPGVHSPKLDLAQDPADIRGRHPHNYSNTAHVVSLYITWALAGRLQLLKLYWTACMNWTTFPNKQNLTRKHHNQYSVWGAQPVAIDTLSDGLQQHRTHASKVPTTTFSHALLQSWLLHPQEPTCKPR